MGQRFGPPHRLTSAEWLELQLRAAMELPHVGRDSRSDLVALLQREYDASSVLLCGSGTQALTIALLEH
ncbi:MAG: hypothetical protein M3P26_10265 [Gemmatimonadota bacterium]|nr:hypothetical protein [Gemmatimonadota bacterium]